MDDGSRNRNERIAWACVGIGVIGGLFSILAHSKTSVVTKEPIPAVPTSANVGEATPPSATSVAPEPATSHAAEAAPVAPPAKGEASGEPAAGDPGAKPAQPQVRRPWHPRSRASAAEPAPSADLPKPEATPAPEGATKPEATGKPEGAAKPEATGKPEGATKAERPPPSSAEP